jgi:hypothetical protein
MSTKRMLVTPAQAQEWLAKTRHQRARSHRAVVRYAHDMAQGYWNIEAAPPILLNATGQVLDGQHRLAALATQPEDFQLTVDIRVVDDSALLVVDTGYPRSLRDQLKILNYPAPAGGSALVNTGVYWLSGQNTFKGGLTRRMEIAALEGEGAKAAAAFGELIGKRRGIFRPAMGTMACLHHMAAWGEGAEQVEAFADYLNSGLIESDLFRRLAELERAIANPQSKTAIDHRRKGLVYVRVYLAWLNDDHPKALFARRRALRELPGFAQWATTWGEPLVGKVKFD